MPRFMLPLALVCCLLIGGTAATAAAARTTASSAPTEAEAVRAAAEYLKLRADAALKSGSSRRLRRVFSTRQGVIEAYVAEGFRALHERMGDHPTARDVKILDAAVEETGERTARVRMTAQVMTSFSRDSRRSCREGLVATHTIDLAVSADGTYSVVSDAYPAEGLTAYLRAAQAPARLVRSARKEERRQASAAAAGLVAAGVAAVPPSGSEGRGDGAPAARGYKGVITYDRAAARAYAKKWWNSRNDNYNDYSAYGGDCANFVSQCTRAGGMAKFGKSSDRESRKWYFHKSDMTDTQSWRYCPTQVDAWRYRRPGRSPARYVVQLSSSKPSDYSMGDVAWKVNAGSESHALICTGFSGSTPLFSCHSSNHWNDPIRVWSGTNKYGVIADQWVIK